jgi:uncharacterized protein YkwD
MVSVLALAAPAAASAGTSCANADLQPTRDNLPVIRDATLCLLNAERTSRGLKKLKSSPQLRRSAQRFSAMMVQQNFFDHVSPGGSTLLSRVRRGTDYLSGALNYALGENIAWGSGHYATPWETVDGWMNSSGTATTSSTAASATSGSASRSAHRPTPAACPPRPTRPTSATARSAAERYGPAATRPAGGALPAQPTD